ncbi:MAG: amidophosphoribosyltransferase [Bacteroidaceae bacterium]|nr:amidophosphoribosyltransferase [Bacteroidaceae bacterium]MBQ8676130.1 amidophosphoribosyltransferase [Bacteroidaceae bacterium]MBQ9176453.1 amidophosphoribosyltransferase [Bacteroidaceae bacterium]MBR1378383.1 amidophosphoribosyltransferase [Bacteroidaceae bacterium]
MGGFFGTVSTKECINDLFYGTDYNSHLGTMRGGMATYDKEKGFLRSIHNLESSYFRTAFEDKLEKFKGNAGIGIISDTDAQPLLFNSHLGRFAIVTVAKVNNKEELANKMLKENMHLSEFSSGKINQTELIGLLIVKGHTFVEGIENVFREVKGSCSLLLLTEDGIIAARDSWGRTPIIIGRKDGAYAATSESTSFPNLGYNILSYLGPGEIVRLRPDSIEQLRKPNKGMQICSFLWVYYGFPTSSYEGINVEDVRYRCGRHMGESDKTEVDCACGIPDSGTGMAIGYAAGHGVPYRRAISKYTPTWPRSFTPSSQERRNLVAKMKLIANRDMLIGQRMLFCDDSIVRGTQLRDNTKDLYDNGAREVHMRISCPPLIYGCPFVNFSRSKGDLELLTRQIIRDFEGDANKNVEKYVDSNSPEYEAMIEEMRKRLNLSSLKFSSLDTLVASIGLPKCKICTHCFDGSSQYTLEQENEA